MVIETLNNSELETREKLMLLLHDLGMVDRYRLATLLNRSVHTIDQTIKRLNKKNPDEKHIVSYTAPFNKGPKLYQLGPAGWHWVMDWMGEDRKYYQRSEAQRRHYNGMNDILIRLIERVGHDHLGRIHYLNTYEATEQFFYPWQVAHWKEWNDLKVRREITKEYPKPDLYIEVDGKGYWIEYETGHANSQKAKDKLRRYYRAFDKLAPTSTSRKPVMIIAPSRTRVENMRSWLNQVKHELEFREMNQAPPEIYFLVAGEETDLLVAPTQNVREEKNIREHIK